MNEEKGSEKGNIKGRKSSVYIAFTVLCRSHTNQWQNVADDNFNNFSTPQTGPV